MPINKALDKNGKPIKKDGKIKYRVRINYTDSYGKNRQIERTAYGADEAKQLERELSHSVKEETPTKKMTFGQLYKEYMESCESETRESTQLNKASRVRIHILPTFEKVRLDRINVPALQKWKKELNEKNLKFESKRLIFRTFSGILKYAVKMEYMPKNPLEQIGNYKAPLEEVKEMDFYTPEEFQLFISEARKYAKEVDNLLYWSVYVFFCIAFYTGMRRGEISALNWNDIKNGEINITKTHNPRLKSKNKITPPKNKSSIRRIQIPIPLQEVLDEHYARCKTMEDFTDGYFVCGGKNITVHGTIDDANKRYANQAGLKRIRIHDFRHSHASLLINHGINIQEIAKRLGHANINITLKTYSHLYPKESERALTVLNSIKIK